MWQAVSTEAALEVHEAFARAKYRSHEVRSRTIGSQSRENQLREDPEDRRHLRFIFTLDQPVRFPTEQHWLPPIIEVTSEVT